MIALTLIESLHKRAGYLEGGEIINLSDYIKRNNLKAPAIFNSARRQNIPAFRERGIWKISKDFKS